MTASKKGREDWRWWISDSRGGVGGSTTWHGDVGEVSCRGGGGGGVEWPTRVEMDQRDTFAAPKKKEIFMGKGLLLWLIGIPIPIILLLWLFGAFH